MPRALEGRFNIDMRKLIVWLFVTVCIYKIDKELRVTHTLL